MFDVVIACIVIAIPSTLALLVIDRGSHVVPTYRTREQELGAAGIFYDYRTPHRRVANLGLPERDTAVLPSGVAVGPGDVLPIGPRTGAAEIASPLASLQT